MRVAGFGLLGFLVGAIAGLVAALLLVFLIYDVLGVGQGQGGDGLSGFASFMVFGPLGALAGGVGGAIWFARRAGSGGSTTPMLIALVLMLGLFVLFFFPAVL